MSTSDTASIDARHVIGGDVKQAKFDRQLRLWGADGQAALEAAHVVVLGATPATAEAVKSLVLAGVRAVTVVDERVVSAEDAAVHYFAPPSAVGSPLAATLLLHLSSLGEEGRATAAQVSPAAWVSAYVAAVEDDWAAGCVEESAAAGSAVRRFLAGYPPLQSPTAAAADGAVVAAAAAPVPPPPPTPSLFLVSERYANLSATSPLVRCCSTRQYPAVPVLLLRSSGFLGFLHTYCSDRVITRPYNPTQVTMEDLRIVEPFPALQRWFDAHDPDDEEQFCTDDVDAMSLHSHLPYPCILHHAFRRWRAARLEAGQPAPRFPLAAADYRAIAALVSAMIRRVNPPEDAFIEAMDRCTAKLNRPVAQHAPAGLAELLADARCADPVTAATAARLCISPAAWTSSCAARREAALLLLWTSPDVLVWFVLHAVKLFLAGQIGGEDGAAATPRPPPAYSAQHMPHTGYVPDFTTTTAWYRELQTLYSAKHAADVDCIEASAWSRVAAALWRAAEEGGDGRSAAETVSLEARVRPLLRRITVAVVENIWDVRGVAFAREYRNTPDALEWRQRLGRQLAWLTRHMNHDVETNIATRRAACFAVAYLCKEELQRKAADAAAEATCLCASAVVEEAAVLMALADGGDDRSDATPAGWWSAAEGQSLFARACAEVVRWCGGGGKGPCALVQLPSVAASSGALAAQEAVKLLMRMRVPSSRPLFYDGYANAVRML
ncbi:hypothetical protein NESM_000529400 [Novymonas esmeraldas]|uniref:THIF-type NAD/FAD binding fold domain-containing protein n=1 Tax=Novymonas esmeraldas TaxID=1808958 RepID=A0AAW0EPF5_9TRYP